MKMIGKDHDRVDHERTFSTRDPKGRAQRADVLDQRARAAVGERDSEEERAAWNEIPPIANHNLAT